MAIIITLLPGDFGVMFEYQKDILNMEKYGEKIT